MIYINTQTFIVSAYPIFNLHNRVMKIYKRRLNVPYVLTTRGTSNLILYLRQLFEFLMILWRKYVTWDMLEFSSPKINFTMHKFKFNKVSYEYWISNKKKKFFQGIPQISKLKYIFVVRKNNKRVKVGKSQKYFFLLKQRDYSIYFRIAHDIYQHSNIHCKYISHL